jgi:hypothetical protein
VSRFDAFGLRTPSTDDAACVHCGDTATADDLCDACDAVERIAGEHERACDCGPCLVFAKIAVRRRSPTLRPGSVIVTRSLVGEVSL